MNQIEDSLIKRTERRLKRTLEETTKLTISLRMIRLGCCLTTIVGHLIILFNKTLSWRFGVGLFVFMENMLLLRNLEAIFRCLLEKKEF